ncbi:unnamed protein product [Leptidea sinapis]|uniref:Uncharacterized protein n=1 Tax=Leptidea sinapis TaxID=189913 RepID=A0A5E4QKQ4_9NEOP|nr:unnamed protein product [Leptidea sinapis]
MTPAVTFILCAILGNAFTIALPVEQKVEIIKYENENDGSGNYKFSFETSDGTIREETGIVVNRGQEDEHISVKGYYEFITTDGNRERITYTADDQGFESPDGTYRKEDGGISMSPKGFNRFAVRGEYHYKDPGGKVQSLKYVADENGFQPLSNNNDYRFNDRRIVR